MPTIVTFSVDSTQYAIKQGLQGDYVIDLGLHWVPLSKALPVLPDWGKALHDSLTGYTNVLTGVEVDLDVSYTRVLLYEGNTVTKHLHVRAELYPYTLTPITVVTPKETVFLRVSRDERFVWDKATNKFVVFEKMSLKMQAVVMMAAHRFKHKLPDNMVQALVVKDSTAIGYNIEIVYQMDDGTAGAYLVGMDQHVGLMDDWDSLVSTVHIDY